jgi:hypothetical protein
MGDDDLLIKIDEDKDYKSTNIGFTKDVERLIEKPKNIKQNVVGRCSPPIWYPSIDFLRNHYWDATMFDFSYDETQS